MSDTKLTIFVEETGDTIQMPVGSAFGVSAKLRGIGSGGTRRTVNARLVALGNPAFRKFAGSISASDMILPPIFDLYENQQVTVEWPTLVRERGATPSRPPVPGTLSSCNGWIEYRPILTCLVTQPPEMSEEEWSGTASWSLELEEV